MSAFDNLPVPSSDEIAKHANSMQAEGAKAGGGQQGFLQYKSRGNAWLFGSSAVNKELVMVHPMGFVRGFITFNEAKRPTKVVRPFSSPIVERHELPEIPPGDEWSEVVGFVGVFMEGELKGEQFLYEPSTYGGRTAAQELAGKIGEQLMLDPAHAFAMVELGSVSYQHPKHGVTYTPDLIVDGWADADGNYAGDEVAKVAAPVEPAPAVEAAREPEPAPADEPDPFNESPVPVAEAAPADEPAPVNESPEPVAEAAPAEAPRRRRRRG